MSILYICFDNYSEKALPLVLVGSFQGYLLGTTLSATGPHIRVPAKYLLSRMPSHLEGQRVPLPSNFALLGVLQEKWEKVLWQTFFNHGLTPKVTTKQHRQACCISAVIFNVVCCRGFNLN